MSNAILAAIPIKPFGVAKRRLADLLDARSRSALGKAVAARTASAATDAGALVAVVTGDAGVAGWARAQGYLTIDEKLSKGNGLDGAADSIVLEAARRQRSWAVVHADLPLVTPAALRPVFDLARAGSVLVPSYDGGTNIIGGSGTRFRFSYGRASFHRHIAINSGASVHTDPRLALDLDTKRDLARALALPAGAWLRDLLSQ
jgi:2-phospho-L-lactate guanylyltransferase